jgi:hypothetical protein
LSYQWQFNGTNLTQATTSILTITNAQSDNAGTYLVVVSNTAGSVTSTNATLTVNTPPSISQQPQSQTVKSGSTANFSVIAGGTAPISYQWRFNGSNLGGETASSLSITDAQDVNSGSYTVVISNMVGATTSSPAILSVSAPQPLQLSNAISDGKSIHFSLSGNPAATLAIESSSNLVNWILITNLVNTNGSVQFDAPIQSDPSLFYRAYSP